jgi:multidrug transporter EmrE-like cation transporter
MSAWIALLIAVLANAASNFAFRLAAADVSHAGLLAGAVSALSSIWFWVGSVLAGLLLASYIYAIKVISLPIAYAVVTTGALSVIALISVAIGYMSLSLVRVAGLVFAVLGIVLLTSSPTVSGNNGDSDANSEAQLRE